MIYGGGFAPGGHARLCRRSYSGWPGTPIYSTTASYYVSLSVDEIGADLWANHGPAAETTARLATLQVTSAGNEPGGRAGNHLTRYELQVPEEGLEPSCLADTGF